MVVFLDTSLGPLTSSTDNGVKYCPLFEVCEAVCVVERGLLAPSRDSLTEDFCLLFFAWIFFNAFFIRFYHVRQLLFPTHITSTRSLCFNLVSQ